ncbi:hypothetical protein [Streptomyces sp. B21-108]|uniref:hypothetical protein n=1 Tax=Streptomyces sp. B21-108 TaxID=3039419 RepID=UPI002FEEF8E2
MRGSRSVGVACWALAAALLLTACQLLSSDDGSDGSAPTTARTPPSSLAPVSGFGPLFLAVGECSSFGTTSFTEVPCGGERAAARVVARHDGTAAEGPPCPPTTDFVLHIGEQPAETGAGTIPQGYACMRTLQPPHPGDAGAGGGPRTIVGDCVYGAGHGRVRETACDGSGTRTPQYKVTKAVPTRANCPPSTALYVQLGGAPNPVGCARPV